MQTRPPSAVTGTAATGAPEDYTLTSDPTSAKGSVKPEKTRRGGHTFTEEDRAKAAEARSRQAEEARTLATDDAAIVAALRKKAAKGDAVAARELREWLDRDVTHGLAPDAWLELLSPAQRDTLRSWIEFARGSARQRHAREEGPQTAPPTPLNGRDS